jgi:hypothetical protein
VSLTGNTPCEGLEAVGEQPLPRHDAVQQPELLEPDAHGNRRHEKTLGKRAGEVIERAIFLAVEIAVDLREWMFDRRRRLQDALFAVGKRLVPSGEDQPARQQKAGGIEIRLLLHPLLGLA